MSASDQQKLIKQHLKDFAFPELFNVLGWDNYAASFRVTAGGRTFTLRGAGEKRGYQAYVCSPDDGGPIPDHPTCRRIDAEVLKHGYLHLTIFIDGPRENQRWFWVRRKKNQPAITRSWPFHKEQSGELLTRKLSALLFTLDEEDKLNQLDVIQRLEDSLDVERVTKRFYDLFKKERDAFAKLLTGIPDKQLHSEYVSVMISRLMFLHFIQDKGLLAGQRDYLKQRFAESQHQGEDRFYRHFMRPLFFQGLATPEEDRPEAIRKLLGKVPYLNGGLFAEREIEKGDQAINIPDRAFASILEFFGRYQWHLDDRPLKNDNEINPDILGYIFEKYINQKQMGAYYTKEDITGYISQNTILPFLLDATAKVCPDAFAPTGPVWSLLADSPDDYLYDAVRRGVIDDQGNIIPLPEDIAAGVADVSKRTLWNKPAADPFGLPTETWREHVARRLRCLELRRKLADGEVHAANDLITHNLDVRQFVQDIVETTADPDLLKAFYAALSTITILDPTCGSGAFLFAALNILEPLYEACLLRMEAFLRGTTEAPSPAILSRMSPAMRALRQQCIAIDGKTEADVRFRDFADVLKQIHKHSHNRRYFIYKSIIVNNLFGVDLMEEATEICKLRLFLKLVSEVKPEPHQPNYGIEPLPDIDFNIRAGNALVGYATWKQIEDALNYGALDFEKRSEKVRQKLESFQKRFEQFQQAQLSDLDRTSASLAADLKKSLQIQLDEVREELNEALAVDYDVSKRGFDKWRKSHHPLNWFSEFYGIMSRGGFDVIVGNPPYVELSDLDGAYTIKGLGLASTGNLYSLCTERAISLLRDKARLGLITPISAVSTPRMAPLMEFLTQRLDQLHFGNFAVRPGKLFTGVDMNLSICVGTRVLAHDGVSRVWSTGYNRWAESNRAALFPLLSYQPTKMHHSINSIPKLQSPRDVAIMEHLTRIPTLSRLVDSGKCETVYYHSGGRYFRKCLREKLSNEYKDLNVPEGMGGAVICVLCSSFFYWFWITISDCYHVTKRDILSLPFPDSVGADKQFKRLAQQLLDDMWAHAETRRRVRADGTEVDEVNFRMAFSRPLMDEIDGILAQHYGFSQEHLDHILGFDARYRQGASDE